jgi:hypothetical protein
MATAPSSSNIHDFVLDADTVIPVPHRVRLLQGRRDLRHLRLRLGDRDAGLQPPYRLQVITAAA